MILGILIHRANNKMYTVASQEQPNGEECSKCWPHTVILPVALSLLNDISIGKISVTIYYTVKS